MPEKEISIEKDAKFNFKEFWKGLWSLLSFVRKQIFLLLSITIFLEIINLIGPYILKIIIDIITQFDPKNIQKILGLAISMFAADQFSSLTDFWRDKYIIKTMTQIDLGLSKKIHSKMLYLSLSYHEKENTGNKIVKVRRGIDKINDLWGNFFWEVGPTIFQIIFTTIVLFVVDWRFGFIFLIFVPAFIIITLKVNKTVFPYRKKRYDLEEESSGMMAQSIININTVKSFVQEEREKKEFSRIIQKTMQMIIFEFGKIFKVNLRRNLIIDIGRSLVLLFGLFLIWKGQISIGSLVFVFTISEKALFSLYRISRLYDRIMDSGEAVRRLNEISQEKSTIQNPTKGIVPQKIDGLIEFKNISFSYEKDSALALDNVNTKIPSGCVTALVGPSGGGKTTLARMIYRHYDPQQGTVLLDGKNLKDYNLFAFRRFIAIVPQEVDIFDSSVRDNIAYAKPDASQEEIEAAAKIANAHEFIENLSQKYDTLVGERGVKLSGGQRQRLGIARAILANPRILIFDEATSNLDSVSEKLIQEAIEKIRKGRTVIIIAHRLSTIKKAEKIIVLERGKIIETGNHLELSQKNKGLYKKLLDLQKIGDVD